MSKIDLSYFKGKLNGSRLTRVTAKELIKILLHVQATLYYGGLSAHEAL